MLEQEYKKFLLENPDSKFTFEEWRSEILELQTKRVIENKKILIEIQKMAQKLLDDEKLKQNK